MPPQSVKLTQAVSTTLLVTEVFLLCSTVMPLYDVLVTRTLSMRLFEPSANMMAASDGEGMPTMPVLVTLELVMTAPFTEYQPSIPLRRALETLVWSTVSPLLPLAQMPSRALLVISELSTLRLVDPLALMPSAPEKILMPSTVMPLELSALIPLLLGAAHTRPSGDWPSGAHR